MSEPILSREEVERLWFEKMGHSIASWRMVGDAYEFSIALESILLEKLRGEPVARLQSYTSNRPFSEGQEFFEVVILDRNRARDDLLLYTLKDQS